MEQENLFLLHALRMGFLISFLYDILRVYRRLFPHGIFWVSVEDLLFWVYCGAEVFLLMHREGNGSLRWFAVLGAMLGMTVYVKLVSPLFLKYSLRIFMPVVRTLRNWRRAAARRIRGFFKNRLTLLAEAVKMKIHRCRMKKRRECDGCGENKPEKAGLGRRFQKAPKGEKGLP